MLNCGDAILELPLARTGLQVPVGREAPLFPAAPSRLLAARLQNSSAPRQPTQPRDSLSARPSLSCRGSERIHATLVEVKEPAEKLEINWDSLGFGTAHTGKTMYRATWTPEQGWQGGLEDYQCLQMDPAAQVLNYGQSVFEGLKAQRSAKGRIVLFRPQENAARMAAGADRLEMAAPPADLFLDAVTDVVRSNVDYVPPHGKGSLYLRPLLLGTGPILGLGPAPSFTLIIFAAAVGSYFKTGQSTPIDLLVENHFHRAAPGGMGGTKAAGNYSPVLKTQLAAKAQGYSDVVYLDAVSDTYLEEVSSCNIFTVKGKTIRTPPLQGTILPGVTRKSVIELGRAHGYTVEETDIAIDDAMEADEVFTTGTAVVLCSVGSLTYKGKRRQFAAEGRPGKVAQELFTALTDIQSESADDPNGWVYAV